MYPCFCHTDFSNSLIDSLISHPSYEDSFIGKIGMTPDSLSWFKKAENLKDLLEVGASALGGAGAGYFMWWSSLSALAKMAVSLGFLSVPMAWPVGGALIATGGVIGLKKLIGKAKKGVVSERPKYINTPLDALAMNTLVLIAPILMKVALADGEFHLLERKRIVDVLSVHWGYCPDFVESYLESMLGTEEFLQFDYSQVRKVINAIAVVEKGLREEELKKAILDAVNEIIEADGVVHPSESEELKKLSVALG